LLYQELISKYQNIDGIRVGIDNVRIGIPFPKPIINNDISDSTEIDPLTKEYEDQKNEFKSKMFYIEKIIKNTTKYKMNKLKNNLNHFYIYSDETNELICRIELGCVYGNYTINVSFNPSKLNQNKWYEIDDLLSVLFMNQYEELYEKGVISRFEFYIDVENVDINDFVLIDEGRRKTNIHKGTTYHGGRKSKMVCTMYDKGAQLNLKDKIMRIEVRLNRRDLKFRDMVEKGIPNPFAKFFVIHKDVLKMVTQKKGNLSLAHAIKEFGVYGLTEGNPPARKELLKQLKEYTVPWWQPELFWEIHKKMLLEFKPAFMGGNIDEFEDDFWIMKSIIHNENELFEILDQKL